MDDVFVWGGAIFGLVCLARYLIVNRSQIVIGDVAAGAILVGSGIGSASGVKLIYYSVLFAKIAPIKDISVAAFLGGITVCLGALYAIYHCFHYRE